MNTQKLAKFLDTVELFHELTPEQLTRLAQVAREKKFSTGQSISELSDEAVGMFVLIEGECLEYVEQAGLDMEAQAARFYPGDSFGIESVLDPRASACRVTAVAPGRVVLISKTSIEELLGESPEFVRTVCRVLAVRLHRVRDLVSGIRFVHLKNYPDIKSVMTLLPRRVSSICRCLVVEHTGARVTVAMVNPSDIRTRSFVEDILRDHQVQFVAIGDEDFERLGRKLLGDRIDAGPEDAPFEKMLYQDARGIMRSLAGSREDDLLSQLLSIALRRGASDVHFEPYQGQARVRLRVDGRMVELDEPITAQTYRQMVARIKVLSELDTTRIRRPLDGRFLVEVDDNPIEFRISASPCHGGEKVVLRVIAPSKQLGDLHRLILYSSFERKARELFTSPSGMVLVTGPSGAGKTTTLYAALRSIIGSNTSKNVVTIEDPVEYDLPFATQIQVNLESGMDFAEILKSVLRQDPDVILVGEIRDPDSAAIAAEAATTGHLVLSSLHTYSAIDAVVRLRDLDVPPYLIAAGLRGVITQQLVPRLEPGFTDEVSPDDPVVQRLVELGVFDDEQTYQLVRGRDSAEGPAGGERGRVAIYEMLSVTAAFSAAIDRLATRSELSDYVDPASSVSYHDYARFLLKEGIVAPERIVDVLPRFAAQSRFDSAHSVGSLSRQTAPASQHPEAAIQD